MATDRDTAEYIVGQMGEAGVVRLRQMFGEYAVYVNERVVALICNNQLFVKPTEEGRIYIGKVEEAPPYPGAKNYFVITDEVEDAEWLTELMRITAIHVPLPKKKKKHVKLV